MRCGGEHALLECTPFGLVDMPRCSQAGQKRWKARGNAGDMKTMRKEACPMDKADIVCAVLDELYWAHSLSTSQMLHVWASFG